MREHAEFKYAWRVGRFDDRTYDSIIAMITKYPEVCAEVWLCMAEPTTYGYHDLDDVERQCEKIRVRMERLRSQGVKPGINLWPTFGGQDHDCNEGLRPPLPYQVMICYDGTPASYVACPSSPEFHAYMRRKAHIMAKTKPDFIWVDDDCRMNYLGAPYPCFCPDCVRRFQDGRFESREELVEALNRPENRELRFAWCAYNADRLAGFCAEFRAAVDEVDPAIETPFMSVGYSHTTYDGDYLEKCAEALRAKAFRPGHGFYWDDTPRELFTKTMEVARQVQRLSMYEDMFLEEESCPCISLDKASSTRLLEIGAALAAGCTGVAFNHLYTCGGDNPALFLAAEMERLHACYPMFRQFNEFANRLPMAGIWPIDNEWKMAGMEVGEDGWFNENRKGYAFDTADSWATFGYALTADPEHAYANLLHGKMVETFSDEEIRKLFGKPVLMDCDALAVLVKRGLGDLAGADLGEERPTVQECLTDHPLNGGYEGSCRSTIFTSAYDLLPLPGWNAEELTYSQSPYGERFGASTLRLTKEGHAPVVIFGDNPYRFIGAPGKTCQMRGIMRDMGAPLLLTPRPGTYTPGRITPFVRTDGQKAGIVLINATLDAACEVDLEVRTPENRAILMREGHPEEELACIRRGDWLIVPIDRMEPWEMWMILVGEE